MVPKYRAYDGGSLNRMYQPDEVMAGVQVVEKVVYKESPTARLPDYFNNNNDGKLIKWKESRRFRGGKVWAKRT